MRSCRSTPADLAGGSTVCLIAPFVSKVTNSGFYSFWRVAPGARKHARVAHDIAFFLHDLLGSDDDVATQKRHDQAVIGLDTGLADDARGQCDLMLLAHPDFWHSDSLHGKTLDFQHYIQKLDISQI